MSSDEMYVTKRSGSTEIVSFDKILHRIKTIGTEAGVKINYTSLAMKIIDQLYDKISTTKIDDLTAEQCAALSSTHYDYGTIASHIVVSNHHKSTVADFREVVRTLFHAVDKNGNVSPLLSKDIYDVTEEHADAINAAIDFRRDYLIDYFGFRTLEKSYLMRSNGVIIERPQHMWMRVAIGIHGADIDAAIETYHLMSQKYFTHATPTLFNAGTPRPQLSSCFIEGTEVYTMRGVLPIESVEIGDEVVTHTGNVQKVVQLHKNLLGERKLFNIKVAGTPTLTVTDNHRLWSLSIEQEKWGYKPSFNSVEYLRVGDWISIPNKKTKMEDYVLDVKDILDNIDGDGYNVKYKYVYGDDDKVYTTYEYVLHKKNGDCICEKKTQAFNRYWTFDNEFIELIGMWYGDGCITHVKNSQRIVAPRSISIVSYHTNVELINFVKKMFPLKLGINDISVYTDKNGMVQMTVFNTIIARIFKQVFGSKFSGKQLPAFFNKFGYDQIRYFLAGLTSTDGCLSMSGSIQLQLTNPPLMKSIFHLARSVGIPVTLTLLHKVNCNATGRMLIPHALLAGLLKKFYKDDRIPLMDKDKKKWVCVKIIDGVTFMRLNEKYLSDIKCDHVYTLGIENDHSYSIGGIIAENCFLIAMEEDSIDGIYNTLKDCALISKWAGGIGMHIHNVRATGSQIRGTNGNSNGIVPMLRVFNNTAKYVDQCVTPETYIYTTEGPIEIQNCTYGETKVFNLTGGVETIENVLEHPYEGQIYNIETMHSIDNLRITPEHPVYALVGQVKGLNYGVIENRLNKNISKFEWVDAKDLQNDDMLVYKIPTHSTDIHEITNDDCYMYGVLLGDGCLNNADQNGYISLHTTNKKYILDFAIQYFENKCIQYRINTNENTTRIYWHKNINMPFRYSDLYDSNKTKRVHHKWLNLPIEKSKYVLKGLIDTDGCKHLELSFDSTSRNLIESVRFLCLKLGVLTSGYTRDRIGETHMSSAGSVITNQQISWCLKIPQTQAICELLNIDYNDNQFFKFFRYNDFLLTRIKSIRTEEYSGTLYDLQMKTQHDYMIHNCIVHNGGGRRNGSFAIYLEPWHADIEMFLEMRKNHGDEELKARDLFYALWVPDLFMERVKADGTWTLMCPNECPGLSDVYGQAFAELYTKYEQAGKGRATVKARELWFKVLDAQMETGTPYICYKDAANRKSNQQNVGTIKSSNLCVAPETIILTDKGHIEIQSLENKKVNVWNGEEYSEVEVKKTGENQKLIEVHTDDESILTCTPYHKFYVQTQYSRSKIIQTEAQNLKPGDKIIKCEYPIIDGTNTMLYPYTHGFFCGDGTYGKTTGQDPVKCEYKSIDGHSFCKRHLLYENENMKTKTYEDNVYCNGISYEKKPKIFLYGEKKELLDHMTYRTVSENSGRLALELPMDIEEKFYVPLNHTLKDKMDWFSGYCDADGTIANNGTNQQLQVASINKDFLLKVRLMLQTCGINPKVRKNKEIGTSLLPDGRGGQRLFETQEVYRLLITSTDLRILVKAGFTPKRLIINTENIIQRSASQFIKIKEIVDNNRIDDTFCFTEPKRHMGIFNGIITGQCSEIMEYSDENETAVCNLASIALPTFVENGAFNYDKLADVAGVITRNLNRVIDINYYPTEKTRVSNMRHRPIGIGVQGLADVFLLLNVAYHSDEARELNRLIFETIYYGAVKASADLAVQLGPYPSFAGSPASKGELQFDLWNVAPTPDRYDWTAMKAQIQATGMRNSLLLAPMPTASTSQILGFNECFEPFTSNIYSRRTMAGEFILTNKYLMRELISLGLWNTELKNNIIANQGSIQHIENLPADMKQRYKTVWEIPMRHVIDMAAERGAFICQSQSLNLWIEDPTYNSLTSMHFYSWSKGLKTGIYYLRRRGKHRAQQFTIEPKNGGECELCSS